MANDKIEITDEMIADAKGCTIHSCGDCKIFEARGKKVTICAALLATALEAERAKGPGVWDGAPDWAQIADIRWRNRATTHGEWRTESYTRNAIPRLRAESIIGPKGERLDGDEWERAVTAVEREFCRYLAKGDKS